MSLGARLEALIAFWMIAPSRRAPGEEKAEGIKTGRRMECDDAEGLFHSAVYHEWEAW